jgi:dTDP-4-amino-4,6-dideoxygalactose transaminase
MATFHALRWCHLKPVFVDCEPDTLTVDVEAVRAALTPRTVGVMAVSLFGNPPDWPALEALCAAKGLALFSDSAHGLGTLLHDKPLGGWGSFEVFSLSPTKLLPAAEGGLVATREERVATWVRSGRDYGNPGSYDCEFAGLNARMSEFHALLGLAGVENLDSYAAHRNRVAEVYHAELGGLPGIRFQKIREGVRSSYKDFPILVDPEAFGIDRDHLGRALQAEGIPTRAYFFPAGHEQTAYADLPQVHLPHTERLSRQVLCLPIASHMDLEEVRRVAWALRRIHARVADVKVSG